MNRCAFASPLEGCVGRPQWHHVISKNRLKRKFPHGAKWSQGSFYPASRLAPVEKSELGLFVTLADILRDERNRMWLCDHHHQKVTNARLYVDIPESAWSFAKEFGLEGMLENDIARRAA